MIHFKQKFTLLICSMLFCFPGLTQGQYATHQYAAVYETNPLLQSASLKSELLRLENDFKVSILFEDQIVEGKTIQANPKTKKKLEPYLQELLQPLDLSFKKMEEGVYIIKVKDTNQLPDKLENKRVGWSNEALELKQLQAISFPSKGSFVQQNISGTVLDGGEGTALPGVNILAKGTSSGTVTDVDGKYRLTVTDAVDTLVFSSIGYVTDEVAINGRTEINVDLMPDIQSLKEIVVIGYGTQERENVTNSVASVSSEKISRQAVAGFDQALQGQAPGVQVTAPSGAPGSGININIRGNNSISLTNSPLYVIDGVPVLPSYDQEIGLGNQRLNPLNTLNPNDIESIDILKDGAAAAIYGLRASNGVVVITTKKGKAGEATVNFNAYHGWQQVWNKLDVLNGPQFAQLYNDQLTAIGLDPAFTNPQEAPTLTNWQDEIFRTAPMSNYQLSFSGGTDKTKYYLSGGYFSQDGIILNSGFERYNLKLNLDQTMSDRMRVGTSLNMSRTNNNNSVRSELSINNGGVILGALSQIPTIPVYNDDGSYSINPFVLVDNPVGQLLETNNKANISQVIGNVYGEYDFLPELTFKTSLGIDFRNQIENQFITRDLPGTSNADPTTRGSAITGTNNQTVWLWENTFTYDKPLAGPNSNMTLLAGFSMQESKRFTSGANAFGFPSNAVPYLYAATQINSVSSYEDEWGLMSYFARGIFNLQDKYLITASLRADGSSRFDQDNRFGFFPALSLGWKISNEPFFPESDAVSSLKLRLSAAANGNQEIPIYGRFSTYATGQNYPGSDNLLGGIGPSVIGNDELQWETTYQYNLGVDLEMFKNRITVTADAYLKQTKNLLTTVPLPLSTGFSNVVQNIGEIENKGIELGINSTNLTGALAWTTSFNISMNRNKVVDLGQTVDEEGNLVDREIIGDYYITKKGQPLGAFYGYVVNGIFQNEAEIAAAANQPNAAPGDIQFKDSDENGTINGDDREVIGNPNPDFIAGITNNLSYKGFELSFLFQGSFGNDIYNQTRTFTEGMYSPLNASTSVLNRWTPENTATDMPRAVQGDPNNNRSVSTRFIEDGTYVRLKNVTLGYNFSAEKLETLGLGGIRLYVTGQNLLTFTNYSGFDPEVSADPFLSAGFGRDYAVYPQARTFLVGVNVQF